MTRRLISFSLLAFLVFPASSFAQTYVNPHANSRYAPSTKTAAPPNGQVAGPQPVPPQPVPPRSAGPQPLGGQPIRISAGQQAAAAGVRVADARPAAPGDQPAVPPPPSPPAWANQMTAQEEKWVGDVLLFWEGRSEKIKRFECKFKRWDYDPVFGPKTGEAKTYSEGMIKYAQPDKGLFRVEKLFSYARPGDAHPYVEQDASFGEHWVCDGKVVYTFEAPKRQLTVTVLPPELQGRAIVDGPLPFLFGAKAETIRARYWIHELPPKEKQTIIGNLPGGVEAYYALEAVPKGRQDAQNFSKVWIVLDKQEFLPQIIAVFAPNYDPQRNPARQTYMFEDRKTDDAVFSSTKFVEAIKNGLDPLNLWHREFFEPKLPAGWKKVVQNDLAGGTPQQANGPAAPPRTLQLPR